MAHRPLTISVHDDFNGAWTNLYYVVFKWCFLCNRKKANAEGEKNPDITQPVPKPPKTLKPLCPFPSIPHWFWAAYCFSFSPNLHPQISGRSFPFPTACPSSGSSTVSHPFSPHNCPLPAFSHVESSLGPVNGMQVNNALWNSWMWVFNKMNSWMICTWHREEETSIFTLKEKSLRNREIIHTHIYWYRNTDMVESWSLEPFVFPLWIPSMQ